MSQVDRQKSNPVTPHNRSQDVFSAKYPSVKRRDKLRGDRRTDL
jgi:hypothetical protein